MKKAIFLALGILGMVAFLFAADIQFGNKVNHEARAASGDTLQVDTFTQSGNWIAPAGVTSVNVEAWGAGGGGTTNVGGGGGGAYASSTVSVTPGTAYWIQVGTSSAGAAGTTSTFATTTVVAAPGWEGQKGAGGGAASSTGNQTFSGGPGQRISGNSIPGGPAGDQAAGALGTGGSRNGSAGATGISSPGSAFGTGGASTAAGQAAGAQGQVRITYTSSVGSTYPTVVNRSWASETANGKSHAITLPGGVQTGDLLLIVFGIDGTTNTSTISAGWTSLEQQAQGNLTQSIFYKVATGSDSATITTANSEAGSYIVYRIQDGGTPVATSSRGSGVAANSPNLDTGVDQKYLWLSSMSLDESGTINANVTSSPSNFVSFVTQPSRITNRNGVLTAVSENYSQSQALDPGAWANSGQAWVAMTIAIPFSGGAAPGAVAGPNRRQRIIFID